MCRITFSLACLACAAQRFHALDERWSDRVFAATAQDNESYHHRDAGKVQPLAKLATVLLAFNQVARPNRLRTAPISHGVRSMALPRISMKEEEKVEQKTVEEVTEKYGLEAGLFSIFKRKQGDDGKGSVQQAGDLLKRYGGAYLLTSTSLAAVSFALCYVAVNNGVDMGALLSKVGLEVSQSSETAGTVGLAYAIHKALSPVRFPPTVALTPIVAKQVFGKTEEGDDAVDN